MSNKVKGLFSRQALSHSLLKNEEKKEGKEKEESERMMNRRKVKSNREGNKERKGETGKEKQKN